MNIERNAPAVSVLMTTYNREEYVGEAIKSVLASAFTDFELLIVDDNSTDGTVEVINKFQSDLRVRVFQNKENLGQFGNRNKAASLARGKYLKYVDSDDLIYPYALSIMVNAMERFPEAGFGVFTNSYQDEKPFPYLLQPSEAYRQYYFKCAQVLGMGPLGTIFKRDDFQKTNGFTNYTVCGDNEFMLSLALHCPVVKIGTCQFWWRRHEGQSFAQPDVLKIYTVQNYLINTQIIHNELFPLTKIEVRKINKGVHRIFLRSLLRNFILKFDFKNANSILKDTKFTWRSFLKAF